MRISDYKDGINEFEDNMSSLKLIYKNDYNDRERKNIYQMARKMSRTNLPKSRERDEKVQEKVLRPFFLRSLKVFESSLISDYFSEKSKKIKLIRDSSLGDHEANLYYVASKGRETSFKVYVPTGDLTISDQMSYAHEMGHVPEIEKPRKTYLEYTEALPIFMEYIIENRRYKDSSDALDHFSMERLHAEQEEARDLLKIYKECENKNKIVQQYQFHVFADYYKYLESLDYTLQLIDLFDEDKDAVTSEIEKVINGKSMNKVAKDLDINTDGCMRLRKEFKRISR